MGALPLVGALPGCVPPVGHSLKCLLYAKRKGGGFAYAKTGGILLDGLGSEKTIPQSPAVTAPFTQGSLGGCFAFGGYRPSDAP